MVIVPEFRDDCGIVIKVLFPKSKNTESDRLGKETFHWYKSAKKPP